jgi:hypothetical protein
LLDLHLRADRVADAPDAGEATHLGDLLAEPAALTRYETRATW